MNQITDADAYKRGFDRGYTLCLSMKKLTREFSAVLRSVASKDFQHSYGLGLQDGYSEGFRNVKKDLAQQKLEEYQAEQQPQKQQKDTRTQNRQAAVQQMETKDKGRDEVER